MRQCVTGQTTIEIEYLRLPVSTLTLRWRVRNRPFMAYVWRCFPEKLVGWVWKRKLYYSNHQSSSESGISPKLGVPRPVTYGAQGHPTSKVK